MLYLPPLRRFLLPSLLCLMFILYYRSQHRLSSNLSQFIVVQPDLTPPGERIPIQELETRHMKYQNPEDNYKSPDVEMYYSYDQPLDKDMLNDSEHVPYWSQPAENPYMKPLYECSYTPNPHTNHIRLPYYIRNVSMVYKGETDNEKHRFLNPAIISLPFWAENQYLLVGRVHTDGSYMENLMCEANMCYSPDGDPPKDGENPCNKTDLDLLGGTAGLRCAMAPITLNVPPTPAESCQGSMSFLMDIPGFHDPRIFWSERGEPLMMMNSQSRYACFGLWVIDLRKQYFPLDGLLAKNPWNTDFGPLMSYPSLTEITRNPPHTRGQIEKNWMFFSTRNYGTYVHYDTGPTKRSFAKLLGGGLSTVNLTDPFEQPCLEDVGADPSMGSWHQGTNSLRLILCQRNNRNKEECKPNGDNEVFFALIHHKHKGPYGLPIRYERYFIVWSAVPPFSMLGISKHPVLMKNETAHPWSPAENWEDDEEQQRLVEEGKEGKEMWATFTYTVSLAYAWRNGDQPQDKNVGYLDDDVILGIGVDDWAMVYARVPAKQLISCLRACPGRSPNPLSQEDMAKFSPDAAEVHYEPPDDESNEEEETEPPENAASGNDQPPEGHDEDDKRTEEGSGKAAEDTPSEDGEKKDENTQLASEERKDEEPQSAPEEHKDEDTEKKEENVQPAPTEDKKEDGEKKVEDEQPAQGETKDEVKDANTEPGQGPESGTKTKEGDAANKENQPSPEQGASGNNPASAGGSGDNAGTAEQPNKEPAANNPGTPADGEKKPGDGSPPADKPAAEQAPQANKPPPQKPKYPKAPPDKGRKKPP